MQGSSALVKWPSVAWNEEMRNCDLWSIDQPSPSLSLHFVLDPRLAGAKQPHAISNCNLNQGHFVVLVSAPAFEQGGATLGFSHQRYPRQQGSCLEPIPCLKPAGWSVPPQKFTNPLCFGFESLQSWALASWRWFHHPLSTPSSHEGVVHKMQYCSANSPGESWQNPDYPIESSWIMMTILLQPPVRPQQLP